VFGGRINGILQIEVVKCKVLRTARASKDLTMQLPGKAEANPTKAFFVRMITRDISLADCILDLIDNSVDAAWQLKGAKALAP
jgi:hypothetical protein